MTPFQQFDVGTMNVHRPLRNTPICDTKKGTNSMCSSTITAFSNLYHKHVTLIQELRTTQESFKDPSKLRLDPLES